jgi:hypothetical protein
MCRGEERPCRERGGVCDKYRFTNSQIVEYRRDAVGPLLQGWQCAGHDWIGGPCAGLV